MSISWVDIVCSIDNKYSVCYIFPVMGIKERRTKILLTLFLLSDVDLSFVDFDERVEKISDLYFNQKTKSSLNLLIKDGVIEKDESVESNSNQKSKGRYRLTEKGWGS